MCRISSYLAHSAVDCYVRCGKIGKNEKNIINSIDKTDCGIYSISVVSTLGVRVLKEKRRAFGGTF